MYDDVDGELNEAAARFTLGSPRGTTPSSPLPSPGCGGGAFGVEIWQQQYQQNLAFTQVVIVFNFSFYLIFLFVYFVLTLFVNFGLVLICF